MKFVSKYWIPLAALVLATGIFIILSDRTPQTPSRTSESAETASAEASSSRVLSEEAAITGSSEGLSRLRVLLDSGNLHQPGRMSYLDTLALADFPEALEHIRALPDSPDRDLFLSFLLEAWGRLDPVAALSNTEGLVSPKLKASIRDRVYAEWLARDLPGTAQWLAEQPAIEGKEAFRMGRQLVERSLAETDEGQTLDFLARLQSPHLRREAASAYAALSPAPADTLLQWAGQLEDAALREGAIPAAAQRLAREDPQRAAAILSAWEDLENCDQALVPVASQWLHAQPTEAIEWLYHLDSTEAQREAVHWAFATYTIEMLQETKSYDIPVAVLEGLPDGPALDKAMSGYLQSVGLFYPEYVFERIGMIDDPQLRNEVLYTVGRNWVYRRPDEASAAIAASSLDEERQYYLLHHAPRVGALNPSPPAEPEPVAN
ncbi:MAG: hypothetical protein ACFBZ8_12735 [Opitutales bacterium]